jgi:addiction module RelE/StbE family toxin
MQIEYLPHFARQYKKLSHEIKGKAKIQEVIFRKDPFDSRLKTHKLSGRLKDFYSFSVTHSYRIVFELAEDQATAYFHEIGTHDIYN